MNSDPNSDSKQCLELKLGQVHSVHTPMAQAVRTLRAGPAVSWRTRRSFVAFPRSYRSLCPAVLWLCHRRVAAHTHALASRVAALLCVSQGVAAPYCSLYYCPYCDTKAAPSHDTIMTPPLARPHALASARPCVQAGRVVRVASRIVVVLGRVAPPS